MVVPWSAITVTRDGHSLVLMAREVQFDGQTLTLRDTQGLPVWNSLRRGAAR